MVVPRTQFARAGEVNIGYQVIGDGPIDLVWAWGGFSNIDVVWDEPSYAAFLRRLSEFARIILFDRRGCGVSDREGSTVTPTLEERMDDTMAVLNWPLAILGCHRLPNEQLSWKPLSQVLGVC